MTTFRPAAIALAALLLVAPTAHADEAPDRDAIRAVVRELLLAEPELVYEALREYQNREEQRAQARTAEAIRQLGGELDGPDAVVVGNPQGDVTLVEFFDYRCGYCRRMLPTLQTLLDRDPKLRIVLKDFPILGPDSLTAARAAVAARRQDGDFWRLHVAMMEAEDLSEAAILALAQGLGFDAERLARDMRDPSVDRELQANIGLAQRIGINGTPAYVLGGELIPGAVPLDELTRRMERIRGAG
jgi:protein-disulfide isomerase